MIDAATREQRIEALRGEMTAADVALVAVAPGDNLRYLLGFSPHGDERACLLLVGATDTAAVMPGLNADQAAGEVPELTLLRWSDDGGPGEALAAGLGQVCPGGPSVVAVDPEMRADHLLLIQGALPGARTVDATTVIGPLREAKGPAELEALQAAAAVADTAMLAAFAALRAGVTETAVAEAAAQVFGAHDSPAEFLIVGAGSNSAFPHHQTGPRVFQDGDAVVIDIGGRRAGYVSDITRMAFVGEPSDRYREVHGIVETALVAGLAASGPGATCAEVDAAARGVIEDAGYGRYFVHRTGHGLGLSGHEPPWIMATNDTALRPGVVHSVEPGIYLPGEFGVRLEEIVSVTETGCRRFSALGREVHVVR